MDMDLETAVIFIVLLMVPAVVVFSILVVIRGRRGKFHRQRITKRSSKTEDEETQK